MPRQWMVEFHPRCEAWADLLEQADAEALLAAIRVLRDVGPALGRPLVDTVEASRHANMKELRPGRQGEPRYGRCSPSTPSGRRSYWWAVTRARTGPAGTSGTSRSPTIGLTSIRQRWRTRRLRVSGPLLARAVVRGVREGDEREGVGEEGPERARR